MSARPSAASFLPQRRRSLEQVHAPQLVAPQIGDQEAEPVLAAKKSVTSSQLTFVWPSMRWPLDSS
jgi:hypothetical protein